MHLSASASDRLVEARRRFTGDVCSFWLGLDRPLSRFVIGSFEIDTAQLGSNPATEQDGSLWRLPLRDRTDADAFELRGLKVAEVKFGQGRQLHYHWYDAEGRLRWDGRPADV